MKEIPDQAEEFVEQYANKKFNNAFQKVQREQHGKGCGCNSCKHFSVKEVNSWAEYISRGKNRIEFRVESDKSGWLSSKLKITARTKDDGKKDKDK